MENDIKKIATQILKIANKLIFGQVNLTKIRVDLALDTKHVHVDLKNAAIQHRIEEQLKSITGFNGIASFIPVLNIQVDINIDTEKTNIKNFQRNVANKFKNFRTPSLRIQ